MICDAYAGARICLLTQHGKEQVIAPVLEPALGCRVETIDSFDTDQLGTFTREIPRAATQLEAARKKARLGMELSGLSLGLASEGSFGPDPMVGLLPWNVELLIFIDDKQGLEVFGVAQGKTNHAHLLADDWTTAESFARQAEFPSHQLVLRPEGENDSRLRKGIADWEELKASFSWAQLQSTSGQVFLETDLRAYANPTRMNMIRLAAEDLVARLASLCPACGTPGFWLVERLAGLPCGDCGAPTRETCAEVYGCLKCAHRERRDRTEPLYADPGRCDYCNP